MAMTGENLLTRIKASYGADSEGNEIITHDELLKKFCNAIVAEITENGLVAFTPAQIATIVSPPGTAGGPCTGTLTGGKIT